jgi:hypothetical protein
MTVAVLRTRLRTLPLGQLEELRDYERAHANRATVLTLADNRIARLTEAGARSATGGNQPAGNGSGRDKGNATAGRGSGPAGRADATGRLDPSTGGTGGPGTGGPGTGGPTGPTSDPAPADG